MSRPILFEGKPLGLLKSFSHESGRLEVDAIVPWGEGRLPGFGEILLIEQGPDAAIVGRVCGYQPGGRLLTEQGDAYLADLTRTGQSPPASVISSLLRYTVRLAWLGHLRVDQDRLAYRVGSRGWACFGSRLWRPSGEALTYLCNVNLERDPTAAELGVLAYGAEVRPEVPVRFSVARLKGRRSFIFARAGYGKSNLVKYLVAQL